MKLDVVRTNWHCTAGKWNNGFGMSKALAANTPYVPGAQNYYQTGDFTNVVPANITLNSVFQFIYGGYNTVPD